MTFRALTDCSPGQAAAVQQRVFCQAEKELTRLAVLSYEPGVRKRSFKKPI